MASDATSLASGESCRRSSRLPTTNIAPAASSTATHAAEPIRSAELTVTPNPTAVAAAIAIPPIVGVGARCQRSGRGGTTAPIAGADLRTTAPKATAAAVARANARMKINSGRDQLAGPCRPVTQHERTPAENTVADCIQSRGFAGQQLREALELQAVDRIARLRLDKRQRNHPVEEEMVGIASPARQLRRIQPAGKRQPIENPDVLLRRAGVKGDPLAANPRLTGHHHRLADAGQFDAGLGVVDDDRIAE